MAITKEEIKGTKIINEIKSSNIKKTEEVPHQSYTQFRKAESQGKFFTTDISKKFKYKKL
jgi:hypothetical protein